MEEILVPLGLFAMVPLIVWAVCAYRYKTKKAIMKLLDTMSNKGEPITPATIYALGIRPRNKHADLRTGVVLVALALAFILCGGAIPEEDAQRGFAGIAMFPLMIGLAYLGLWAFIGRKQPDPLP